MVILRGAVDGLAAVPPHGDKDYQSVRGQLALSRDGAAPLHDLDGMFGLHPSLANMKSMYDAKELVVFQNICSPYRDRSHFDGQNVLESGGTRPHLLSDGWLNRALAPMGLGDGVRALAVAQTPPLLLTGQAQSHQLDAAVRCRRRIRSSWRGVRLLYAHDPALRQSLDDALALQNAAMVASDDPSDKKMGPGAAANLEPLFSGAGRLLAAAGGPRVAVLDVSGWDTHVNEGAGDGQLARRLAALDRALIALKTALGPAWGKTAIVMATEFGRTAHPNGNGGTDHGTGRRRFPVRRCGFRWHGAGGMDRPGPQRAQGWPRPAAPHGFARAVQRRFGRTYGGSEVRSREGTVFPDSAGAPAMTVGALSAPSACELLHGPDLPLQCWHRNHMHFGHETIARAGCLNCARPCKAELYPRCFDNGLRGNLQPPSKV